MRLIQKLSYRMFASRLNGAYKKLLNGEDGNLITRDIVGFSELGLYNPDSQRTRDQLIELRGRQQMALHILRHIDIDAIKQIEHQNDAQAQGSYFESNIED